MNSTQHPSVEGEILKLVKLNNDSFQAEEDADAARMGSLLAPDFTILRPGDLEKLKVVTRDDFLNGLAARRRLIEDVCVKPFGEVAVITSLLSIHDEQGQTTGRFWNTKVCVKQANGEWLIRDWRVNRIS
jgi:hypothetical protein